jgi:predicted small secreted protein
VPEYRAGWPNQQSEDAMRKNCARIFAVLILLGTAGSVLSACNTTAGAGKDIKAAGQAIDNSAEEHKNY